MDVLLIIPYKGFVASNYPHYLNSYLNAKDNKGGASVYTLTPPYCFEPTKLLNKKQNFAVLFSNFFYLLIRLVSMKRRGYDVIILGGQLVTIPFLLINMILPFKMARKSFIVTSFFVHKLGKNKVVQKMLQLLFSNDKLFFLAQSPHEVEYYSNMIDKDRILFFPYCRGEISALANIGKGEEYIFAGGYTNRDYECLLNAAQKVDHDFLLICSKLNRIDRKPSNVRIMNDVNPDEFYGYLKNSKIVVIPLCEETGSSGQMVALGAMFFKKAVVYTNVTSLSQYFEDGITGLSYRKGDAEDLADKILHLLANPNLVKDLGINAFKKYYENFHVSKYFEFLADLILK